MQRESMEFDVVIVGAGPAGLSAAIRLKQLNDGLNVVVLEKGSEIGAHILSGAVFETRALDELLPDWKDMGAPLNTPVSRDEVYLFTSKDKATRLPNALVPKTMHNNGNYIISLGNLCRWLAEQAEGLGVEIFPGFAAAEILYNDNGYVAGVATGDMGRNRDGTEKGSFEPGMELLAQYTLFAEGSRGHLGKQLIQKFKLDIDTDPQHYGLGIKELWEIDSTRHEPGLVMHGAGWPLSESGSSGGSFLYHAEDNQVVLGLITDLNYQNPHLSPFEEFQRFKHQPVIRQFIESGKRISYGARAITKGGFNALPKANFPGGLLIGCEAGTLNFAKIKGCHTAMKSGMLAAENVVDLLASESGDSNPQTHAERLKSSWLYQELYQTRSFGPALHKFGTFMGGSYNFIEQNLFGGKLPFTLHDTSADHMSMKSASECTPIAYPKADGKLSFDRLSSVFLSNTNHEEDQPVHLQLKSDITPIEVNLALYDAPEQRYCPAGVYEIIEETPGQPSLQISAQNCLHCKTCDIKDPTQNITWVTPEGSGGPNYPNM
ncbi:MAG: electron transfer flavoprotein-ubiquinone oxidoreductase [Sedimenticola sp.]